MKKWISWALSGIPAGMMTMSAGMKLAGVEGLAEGFAHLGVPLEMATGLGVLELACVVLYLLPRTAVLGAILIAAYMGGATMTHLRVGDPFWMQPLLGAMAWGGLYLRDARLRELLPLTQPAKRNE